MTSGISQTEAVPIAACTISRDVQNFDLLIEDMESAMGEAWGDLGFTEALAFFYQSEAEALEFVALAIDAEDEENLPLMTEIITQAKSRNIKVILVAEDVTPAALHKLLRQGADEFIPYPLPAFAVQVGEFRSAVEQETQFLKRQILRLKSPFDPKCILRRTHIQLDHGKVDMREVQHRFSPLHHRVRHVDHHEIEVAARHFNHAQNIFGRDELQWHHVGGRR